MLQKDCVRGASCLRTHTHTHTHTHIVPSLGHVVVGFVFCHFQKFFCEHCPNKVYRTLERVQKHMQSVHNRDAKFPCRLCGKKFKDRCVAISSMHVTSGANQCAV